MPDERTLRILVVEDSADSAGQLVALVNGWGYTATLAVDGATAVKTAAVFHPDVVLLDLGLVDMHGYEVAKRIREATPDLRPFFVAITGWAQIADQIQSNAAGIAHHLVKPVNADSLRQILAAYVGLQDTGERRSGSRAATPAR